MSRWRRLLIPEFDLRLLPGVIAWMAAGSLAAGLYGIVHDQITYTIGPEYFTRFKFIQYASVALPDLPPRVFAGVVGFLATWWVGALVVWILARSTLFQESRLPPPREMAGAFGIVFTTAILAAGGGWLWGLWRRATGYAESWHSFMGSLGVERPEEFMTVGYIHNASYLGGLLGTLAAILVLAAARRQRVGGSGH